MTFTYYAMRIAYKENPVQNAVLNITIYTSE